MPLAVQTSSSREVTLSIVRDYYICEHGPGVELVVELGVELGVELVVLVVVECGNCGVTAR